nr:MAG TPA: homing endonuclease [Caudoviricetes sp.]
MKLKEGDEINEIWKDIVGYEGLYKVSNFGNIYSVKRKRNLKLLNNHHGYKRIRLYVGSKNWKIYAVHRLVVQAFIHNPDNLPEVNHKDKNCSNNFVDNLEWCTRAYNVNYGKRIEKTYSAVEMLTLDGVVIQEFNSQVEASQETGVRHGSISNCCRGFAKTAGGYKWRYKNG